MAKMNEYATSGGDIPIMWRKSISGVSKAHLRSLQFLLQINYLGAEGFTLRGEFAELSLSNHTICNHRVVRLLKPAHQCSFVLLHT